MESYVRVDVYCWQRCVDGRLSGLANKLLMNSSCGCVWGCEWEFLLVCVGVFAALKLLLTLTSWIKT